MHLHLQSYRIFNVVFNSSKPLQIHLLSRKQRSGDGPLHSHWHTDCFVGIGVSCHYLSETSNVSRSNQTKSTQTQRQTQPENYDDITQSEDKYVYTTVDTTKQKAHYHNT